MAQGTLNELERTTFHAESIKRDSCSVRMALLHHLGFVVSSISTVAESIRGILIGALGW